MDNGVGGILYLKTPSGILKVLEAVFSLCAFISSMVAETPWDASNGTFFNIVPLMVLIYAIVVIILSVLNVASNAHMGPKLDLILCISFSILTFSAASLLTGNTDGNSSLLAAVIFQYLTGFTLFGNTLHKVMQ